MKPLHTFLSIAAAVATLVPVCASAQYNKTFNGNGSGGFGGPVGQGSLNLTTTATAIVGTITIGGNLAFNDDLVIYIDAKSGGFTDTSSLTDTGGGNDRLRKATSGYNGSTRSTMTFGSGFGADYAIALSPSAASFGSFYTLSGNGASTSNFTYGSDGTNGNMNLTPTGTNNGNGTNTYTFTVPLSLLGGATSINFLTTYLNGNDIYRSNETYGNSITDTSNPSGNPTVGNGAGAGSANYNLGSDNGFLDGVQTFAVPEPSTWLAGSLLVVAAGWTVSRSRRSVA